MRSHALARRSDRGWIERDGQLRPDQLGVYAWYRPEQVIAAGGASRQPADGAASGWVDSSGNGLDLTAPGTAPVWRRGRYGWGAMEFNGVSTYLYRNTDPWGSAAGATMFAVAEWATANRPVIGSFPDRHTLSDQGTFWRQSSGVGYSTNPPSDRFPLTRRLVIRTSTYSHTGGGRTYVNGLLVATAAATGNGLGGVGNGFALGGHNGSGGPPPNTWFNGWLVEAGILRTPLSEGDLAGLHRYLIAKYWGAEREQ